MEVWALYAYGAAHVLQEIMTVKSDDIVGRVKVYEALVKGKPIDQAGIPESFRVLIKEFQALGLDVQIENEKNELVSLKDMEQDEEDADSLKIEELTNNEPEKKEEESLEPQEDDTYEDEEDEEDYDDLDDLEFPGDVNEEEEDLI